MAKFNIYAVAYGINPETKQPTFCHKFRTWDECKPYVVGVEGAKYKGFFTETEADMWLEKTVQDLVQVNEEDKETEYVPAIEIIAAHGVDEFEVLCANLHLDSHTVTQFLKKQFVEQYRFLCDNTIDVSDISTKTSTK